MIEDNKALIQRYCKEGDREALSAFYRRQSPGLWRFLVARGVDRDSAYDLLSEAFLRFLQTVCQNVSAPVALLYRIAINLHIDHYRRAKHASKAADDGRLAADEPAVWELADDEEYLRNLLKSLAGDEQNLLLMRYWIGMTHKEVAQVLKVPPGTIRRRCAAALKKLAARWKLTEKDPHESELVH